jgi:hypothetical protein
MIRKTIQNALCGWNNTNMVLGCGGFRCDLKVEFSFVVSHTQSRPLLPLLL